MDKVIVAGFFFFGVDFLFFFWSFIMGFDKDFWEGNFVVRPEVEDRGGWIDPSSKNDR